MLLTEKDATILALIAQSPERNRELVELLSGDARRVGEALVNPTNTVEADISGIVESIRRWASTLQRVGEVTASAPAPAVAAA